jgi:L-lactate dehydrogenase complex protein LldG
MRALFVERARDAGCAVVEGESPDVQADYALAESGSLVFLAAPMSARRSWLEPEILRVAVAEDRILPDLESLFALVGGDIPSAVAIVTGPSRTADIEQTLVVGVHGPREVHVVITPTG